MEWIHAGNLQYLRAEGICVPHCFTTRLGGVSKGYLSALNIGIHRGDAPEMVRENYRILGRALGFAPEKAVLSTQTHSDIVLCVDGQHHGAGLFAPENPPCDALITNTPGTALVIFTADCTPVLLHDPVTGGVGAIHAGWRGTASQIAAAAVRAMTQQFGTLPENIRAAIGPNIGPCCFRTDGDVPEAMEASYGPEVLRYFRSKAGKYFGNLKEINALCLRRAGVRHIEMSMDCTVCRSDLYWSHRRMGAHRGSQGAIIVCKETHP